MQLEPAPLETERFGIPVVRGAGRGAELAGVGDAARDRGALLAIVRCDAADVAGTHALEAAGARLMDTHLGYECPTAEADPVADDPRVRPARADDLEDVEALARTAFDDYVGHFHADERLAAHATDVYVDWAGRMLRDTSGAHLVWVAEDDDGPLGFATLRLAGDEAVAVLDGMAPRARGTGLHGALVRLRLAEARRHGATRVVFRTHLTNVGARRSYLRNGFLPTTQEHTFHLWTDGQEPRPAS